MNTKPKFLTVLDVVAAVMFVTAVSLVFFYAPLERVMGWVQKVFYFHVASAWVGMLAFAVAAVCGVIYLIKKDVRYDRVEFDAIEIGIMVYHTHWAPYGRIEMDTFIKMKDFEHVVGVKWSTKRGCLSSQAATVG